MSSPTSIESYIAGVRSGQFDDLKARCIGVLMKCPGDAFTANEIAYKMGVPRDSISAILRRASYDGMIEGCPSRPCKLSGKHCITWKLGDGAKVHKPTRFHEAIAILTDAGHGTAALFLIAHPRNN